MHLSEMARVLQITTQELRRELAKTNFGISPTAHEIDDNLSVGVIRYLKQHVKPTLKNRKVAVIYKEGAEPSAAKKEEIKTGEAPKRAMTKKEKEDKERAENPVPEVYKPDRSYVPKNAPRVEDPNADLHVSRRIELGGGIKPANTSTADLPKTYYKGKRNRKKGRGSEEEKVLATIQRHPGHRMHIAKVNYGEEDMEGLSAEELAVMKEQDREHFRNQKKHRAVSQKTGHKAQPQIKAKTGVVAIPSILSLKEFSEKCGLPVSEVISTLLKNGMIATINQKLDYETAEIVASELGVEVKRAEEAVSSEDLLAGDLKKLLQDDKSKLKPRAPIISIMGHVDHGKTKLLDYIRKTNVVATESGGITQHIGAYQVVKNGHAITFLDTPGHEAFTSMRARGAKATDIAILVVAADEGVKPQTVEAINHAKEAGIPIIVAINKIDKPGANPEKVKGELIEHGLQPEDWGGKTIMAPVSAITGQGMDHLLDMILLVAEMEDLKANPNRMAVGTVIESHLDKSLGPIATILVNTGTLKVGDSVVVGTGIGKIKAMHDYLGKSQKTAGPSAAVRISGLTNVPHAGDFLQAFAEEKTARARVEELKKLIHFREESLSGSMVERIVSQINTGRISFLKIVLKADTKGSLEAIMQALQKIKSTDVAVKVIHFGVGNISDTDVVMAAASQALLIGFHIKASSQVKRIAEQEHVDIKNYTVIYKLIEDMKAILSGMLEPEINVLELGTFEIKEIFLDKKTWLIAGATVKKGKVMSGSMLRVKRGEELLFETKLDSLKFVKEDVSELEKGSDCGVQFKTPKPVQVGDIAEVFKVEKKERKLE